MNDKPQKLLVIVEESVIGSLVKDAFTFALFGGLLYFNHAVLAGSTFIDVLFILIVIMFLIGRNSGQVYKGDVKGGIKWLQKKEDK